MATGSRCAPLAGLEDGYLLYPIEIKMNVVLCPNFNHQEAYPPVRFCPDCGKVVNERVPAKQCSEQSHASARMDRNEYCIDCGEQLIK